MTSRIVTACKTLAAALALGLLLLAPTPALADQGQAASWTESYVRHLLEAKVAGFGLPPGGIAPQPSDDALTPVGGACVLGAPTPLSCERWSQRFNAFREDYALAILPSADGSRVFVTGASLDTLKLPTCTYYVGAHNYYSCSGEVFTYDAVTIAYDAATGAELWRATFGQRGVSEIAWDLALSPDGDSLYVLAAAPRAGSTANYDFTVLAYASHDGAALGTLQIDRGMDYAAAMKLSADGSRLFVAGVTYQATTGGSFFNATYVTLAIDLATQRPVWNTTMPGETAGVSRVLLSPDGSTLYVAGQAWSGSGGHFDCVPEGKDDFFAVAYDAANGVELRRFRWDGPDHYEDYLGAATLSPNGDRLFMTGATQKISDCPYYPEFGLATVAFDTATGALAWNDVYSRPDEGSEWAGALVVSPDGQRVIAVGGGWHDELRGFDATAIAYDAASGGRAWLSQYDDAGRDEATYTAALTADGSHLFLSGYTMEASHLLHHPVPTMTIGANITAFDTADALTLRIDTADGSVDWAATYDGPVHGPDAVSAIALSPAQDRLFEAAISSGGWYLYAAGPESSLRYNYDYATIAYDV